MDKQTLSETAAVVAITARFAFINKSLVMTSKIVPLVRLRLNFNIYKSSKSSCS